MTGDEPIAGAADEQAVPPPLPSIPDHQLIRCIGSGAYGQIWLVRSVLGAYRAAKVVYRQSFDSERPYQREFCGIQHYEPHSRSHGGLVNILQVGKNEVGGYFYYLMELADDQITRQNIDPETYLAKTVAREIGLRGRLPASECLEVGLAVTSALHHLHGRGLVHRDIKPENIIYVDGRVKLADIGLVADMSAARTNVGTDGFIPPEGSGTPQADLYAVGKLLYEMATGKDRFDFPEPSTGLGEFADRREVHRLSRVIHRACAAEPERRYHSARSMHADLARLQRLESPGGRSWWRHPLAIITALATGVVGLILAFLLAAKLVSPAGPSAIQIQSWFGPEEEAETAAWIAGMPLPSAPENQAYLIISVHLAREAFDVVEVPTEAPTTGLETSGLRDRIVWRIRQRAESFGLQSGFETWRAFRLACHSWPDGVRSSEVDGGVESVVDALEPPEFLEVTLVFQVPRDLDPEGSLLQYHRGATPLIVPLAGANGAVP